MRHGHVRGPLVVACVALVVSSADSPVRAQSPPAAPPAAATPLAPDGKPDLSGIWVGGGGARSAPATDDKGSIQVFLTVPGLNPDSPNVFKEMDKIAVERRAAGANKPAYRPELLAKVKELSELQAKLDPAFYCKLPGVPRMGPPAQIVHGKGLVVLLYGEHNAFRVVPTDGRQHRTDVEPSYLGDSVGRWEGDTLVVEANQFTEDTWLGQDGYFHSANMRVVERFRRAGNELLYSATVHDPDVLTEPWAMTPRTLRLSTDPADALVEAPPCQERSSQHMLTNEHH